MQNVKRMLVIAFVIIVSQTYAQKIVDREFTYSIKDTSKLKAYVFKLDSLKNLNNLPAIVIFHGGGWTSGDASWAFGRAEHFAKLGFVAIAAQYRLSDQIKITPIDALEDARDIIIWIRTNKELLKIDPNRLAAYGWSAGGHLAASAAIFPKTNSAVSSIPNALVLVSPAVSLERDNWFKKLLMGNEEVVALSPDENVKTGMPPTIILQGREDTVTPLAGVENFANKMKENGNKCELVIYDGVGHLFTPKSEPDDGFPNPDKKVQSNAYERIDNFLRALGYIN